MNATCVAEAITANMVLLEEMIGGKADADMEKHMKKMEKAVILNKVGGVFSECMDIELQGIAKLWPDEKHKVAHAKCKVEFAIAMGNKSTNPEADLSMHFSTLFENIRECADEPDEVARKTCRKRAKDAARAEGVQPSSALQLPRMGQNRAAAKDRSACLSTLAKVTGDTTCAAVAKEALANMSGFAAKGLEDSRVAKIRNLAWADYEGVLTSLKEVESITVDVIEAAGQKSCDTKMKEALQKLATSATASITKLRNVTRMECKEADGVGHHTIEISAPDSDAATRAEISATHDNSKLGQLAAMEQYDEHGAALESGLKNVDQ